MLEPTVEFGFSYLRQLQQFTGVTYGQAELDLVYRLYRERKEFAGQPAKQAQLNQAAADLAGLDVIAARTILDALCLPGDFDKDGDADGADFLIWQQQQGQTGLYPLNLKAADANADGVVDAADLEIWRQHAGVAAGATSSSVPEPCSAALIVAGLAAAGAYARSAGQAF